MIKLDPITTLINQVVGMTTNMLVNCKPMLKNPLWAVVSINSMRIQLTMQCSHTMKALTKIIKRKLHLFLRPKITVPSENKKKQPLLVILSTIISIHNNNHILIARYHKMFHKKTSRDGNLTSITKDLITIKSLFKILQIMCKNHRDNTREPQVNYPIRYFN